MKKLIPIEERESELIKFGAIKDFLENIGKIDKLKDIDIDAAWT
ncbi:hypothetical protein [Aquimarina sp. BL5]|nr:hypothetical protein [Aquimarina sp. BL5]